MKCSLGFFILREEEMISTIGITGKISSGKSSVAEFISLISKDAIILDVDVIAKGLYKKYPEIKKEFRSIFGDSIFGKNDEILFNRLSEIVFSSEKELQKLNSVMFPRIDKEIKKLLIYHKKNKYKIIDAAVLFGANLDIVCDYIILVESDEKKRKIFLKNKIFIDNEIKLKISGQHIKINRNSVDFIIINNGNKKKLLNETEEILKDIEGKEKT